MSRVSFPNLRVSWLSSSRSMKASHMATSLTFESARRACLAAPVPRPPHPTSPTFRGSPPAAYAPGSRTDEAATVAADAFRKSRREVESGVMAGALGWDASGRGEDSVIVREPGGDCYRKRWTAGEKPERG